MREASPTPKVCRHCGVPLSPANQRPSAVRRGYRICRQCQLDYHRQWCEKHPRYYSPERLKWLEPTAAVSAVARHVARITKRQASKAHVAYTIKPLDLLKWILEGRCAWSDLPFDFTDQNSPWAPRLIRRDKSRGFESENVSLVVAHLAEGLQRFEEAGLGEVDYLNLCKRVVENDITGDG